MDVVTGATKGIGRGVAAERARAGARVLTTGRSAGDSTVEATGAAAVELDGTSPRPLTTADV